MTPGDKTRAQASLGEENEAIRVYGKRAAATSHPPLRSALKHARGDEREHARGFRRVLGGRR